MMPKAAVYRVVKDDRNTWPAAYHWLCARRQRAPANADVWRMRFGWHTLSAQTYRAVQDRRYRLGLLRIHHHRADGHTYAQWETMDALMLKWLALTIETVCLAIHAVKTLRGMAEARLQ